MPWSVRLVPSLYTGRGSPGKALDGVESLTTPPFVSFLSPPFRLHRLACFRDDVVFIILLYQRWIYRVDKTRANEYGQVLVDQKDAGDVKAVDAEGESKKTK